MAALPHDRAISPGHFLVTTANRPFRFHRPMSLRRGVLLLGAVDGRLGLGARGTAVAAVGILPANRLGLAVNGSGDLRAGGRFRFAVAFLPARRARRTARRGRRLRRCRYRRAVGRRHLNPAAHGRQTSHCSRRDDHRRQRPTLGLQSTHCLLLQRMARAPAARTAEATVATYQSDAESLLSLPTSADAVAGTITSAPSPPAPLPLSPPLAPRLCRSEA